MKAHQHLATIVGLGLAVILAGPANAAAAERHDRTPIVTAVSGQSDWSLIPVDPKYITSDGIRIMIRGMPLAGLFHLGGAATSLDATIHGVLSADLDMTGTGQIYGPLVLTQNLQGKDIPAFEGRFFGRTDTWLASGQILLQGRGCYAGVTIALSFLETGPDTETFHLNGHLFDPQRD